jgi:uncharacterized protein YxjI
MFETKVKAPASTSKSKHQIVSVPELQDKVSQFVSLKNQIDNLTGQLKMIEGEIKLTAERLYLKQYTKERKRPDNFKIADQTGSQVMAIIMDKYAAVTPEKYEQLSSYELVDTNKKFTFNTEILERNFEVIKEALMNSNISDDDKSNLIEGEVSYSVKSGALDLLSQHLTEIDYLFGLIKPIIALKK